MKGEIKMKMNITPRCENMIPLYIEWFQYGTKEQKELARDHLLRMAKFCDQQLEKDGAFE